VRVSVTGEREAIRSPDEQRRRIAEWCEREGFELVAVHDEIDVSGGKPLSGRPGLSAALEAVESSEADVLAVAYFDRLVRSLVVQAEVVQRVEAAGGRVMALDVGHVTEATAGQWLSSTVIGMVSEYYRRSIGERVAAAEARMVEAGVSPHKPPPGFTRDENRRFVPNEDAPAVVEAFAMRARGETVKSVREFMAAKGVVRSYHGVQEILRNRTYLGEVRRGELVNASAHEPLIDLDTWAAVQRARVSQGRQPVSPMLLARLGVLRCGSCGAVMVSGAQRQRGKRYPTYRCSGDGRDCTKPVYIAAGAADKAVVDAVLGGFGKARGRASAERRAVEAAERAERAQAELDAAIRAFSGLEDEASARARLQDLRAERDEAVAEANHLSSLQSAVLLRLADNWDDLTLDERRRVIVAAVERAVVAPGRGSQRVAVALRH
jgi:DNA invertase Pin-like site-specific DNA recombinase